MIVDLAVEQGGNVEGAVPGEVVVKHGVKIVGHRNVPEPARGRHLGPVLAQPVQFPLRLLGQGPGRPVLPDEDEIGDAIRLTQGGKVVNERLKSRLNRFSATY